MTVASFVGPGTLLKGARLGLKAAARGVSWAARGGLALGKKALEASVLRLWRAAVARLPASTTRPLLETFRKAAGAGGTGPVSLKTLRLVLGRAGEPALMSADGPPEQAQHASDAAMVIVRTDYGMDDEMIPPSRWIEAGGKHQLSDFIARLDALPGA